LPVLDVDAILDTILEDATEFHEIVCGCETCREVLDGEFANFSRYGEVEVRTRRDRWGNRIEYDVPRPEALRFNRMHYLLAKGIEVERATRPGFDAARWLRESAALHAGQQQVSLRHLDRWESALST
jgi:hypothetical protein